MPAAEPEEGVRGREAGFAARGGESGEDHFAAGAALHLGIHIGAKEASERPVVMLAEHDHVGANPPGRFQDLGGWFAGGPRQLGIEPGRVQKVTGVGQVPDHLRRGRQRLALPGRDVVEGAEVAGHVRIQRDVDNAQHRYAPVRVTGFGDRAVECPMTAGRPVVPDQDPSHAGSLAARP